MGTTVSWCSSNVTQTPVVVTQNLHPAVFAGIPQNPDNFWDGRQILSIRFHIVAVPQFSSFIAALVSKHFQAFPSYSSKQQRCKSPRNTVTPAAALFMLCHLLTWMNLTQKMQQCHVQRLGAPVGQWFRSNGTPAVWTQLNLARDVHMLWRFHFYTKSSPNFTNISQIYHK